MITMIKCVFIILIILTLLIVIFMVFSANGSSQYTPREQLDTYKTTAGTTGYYEKKNTLTILNLHGTYDEMGQQYGALAYNQLHTIYKEIVPNYFNGINKRVLLSYMLRLYYNYKLDKREVEILKGMTKTSGLTYRQLLSIEMLPMLITLYSGFNGDKLSDAGGSGHCSFLSVWGNLSATNSMLVARNLDLSTPVTVLDPYYNLVIYNLANQDSSVATFGFTGFIPGFTWLNNHGLFSEYNDGRRSVPGVNFSGYIGLNTAFYAMLDSQTHEEFIQYVKDHPAFISNFTSIVDKDSSHTIEHAANTKAAILTGQSSNANFFTNLYRTDFTNAKITMSNCVEKTKDTPSYACVRYHHIEHFINSGTKIGIEGLKNFFSTPLDNKGVYQTGSSREYPVAEITNYTLIGEIPSGKYIYSNHANPDLWIDIDINRYFSQ